MWHGRTGETCCERKGPTAYLILFLDEIDKVKDLDSRRITLKCENELIMKVYQESMSHLMVRETKKQDRNPEDLISTGSDTSMRITDEVSLLSWN